MKGIIWFVLGIMMVACSNQDQSVGVQEEVFNVTVVKVTTTVTLLVTMTPTATATATLYSPISHTSTSTVTKVPSSTSTPSQTATSTLTPMPESTATSTLTPTPTSTPTVLITPTDLPIGALIPDVYQLPTWMASPQTPLLMTITDAQDKSCQLTFMDAQSGQRANFPFPFANVRDYFFMPNGQHFGFLASDNQSIYLVSLANGQVTTHRISEQVTRFIRTDLSTSANPLMASRSELSDAQFVLLYSYEQDHLSPDSRYFLQQDYQSKEDPLTIIDLSSGQVLALTDPDDGLIDINFTWSPTEPHLAVLQNTKPPGHMLAPGDRIHVYDLTTSMARMIAWCWMPAFCPPCKA